MEERCQFLIYGNGLSSKLCPSTIETCDIPGHGHGPRDISLYNFKEMAEYLLDKVPEGACVWGHSLGGHIALNLALLRPDISIICFGMVPLNSISEVGTIMTPLPEFIEFQKVTRSDEDIINFLNCSALGDEKILEELFLEAKKQDPMFNEALFNSVVSDYDWDEVKKSRSLDERFTLVLSKNEKVYNYNLAMSLDLPIIEDHYKGHTPWLNNEKWFENIEEKLLLNNSYSHLNSSLPKFQQPASEANTSNP